jgi:hypothetical protein
MRLLTQAEAAKLALLLVENLGWELGGINLSDPRLDGCVLIFPDPIDNDWVVFMDKASMDDPDCFAEIENPEALQSLDTTQP